MAVKKNKKAESKEAFCVYLGPSMRGGLTMGQIIPMSKDKAIEQLGEQIRRHPLIAELIVPGEDLPKAKQRIGRSCTLLHKQFEQLAKGQK